MSFKSCAIVVIIIGGTWLFPLDARAHRSGADPLMSGGPAGLGQNCLACHEENMGSGRVELLGVPTHYEDGMIYDLTVRIIDVDQFGAGFQISAETDSGHIGTLLVSDTTHTQYAQGDMNYVTHTLAGVEDSISQWSSQGGQYDYALRWRAPFTSGEAVTIYVAALAINDATAWLGDNMYATTASIPSVAVPTLSMWGLLSMALAFTTAGTLVLRRNACSGV
jgi:hypothetical protein